MLLSAYIANPCLILSRLVLTMLTAYLAFQIIFYRIVTHSDLLKYYETIEFPKDEFAQGFRKFRKSFIRRWVLLSGLLSTALLLIQYQLENPIISCATAIIYGCLGPWAMKDNVAALMKTEAHATISDDISKITQGVDKDANDIIKQAYEIFSKAHDQQELKKNQQLPGNDLEDENNENN